MSKKLEDMTFDELVEYVAIQLHGGLLEGGGREFKARLHLWLSQTILWSKSQEAERAKRGNHNRRKAGT